MHSNMNKNYFMESDIHFPMLFSRTEFNDIQ